MKNLQQRDQILTGFEQEGFAIDSEGKALRLPSTTNLLERIRYEIGLVYGYKFSYNRPQQINDMVSVEEHWFHIENKNPKPLNGYRSALDLLNFQKILIQDALQKLNATYELTPFLSDTSYQSTPADWTPRGHELHTHYQWSPENLHSSIISGLQINRGFPTEILNQGLQTEYAMHLYNAYHDQFSQICTNYNSDNQRVDHIASLLMQADSSIFTAEDIHQSYMPGPFESTEELFDYMITKSRYNPQDGFDPKSLHSLSIKLKGQPKQDIQQFSSTHYEVRILDTLDTFSPEGREKVEDFIHTVVIPIEEAAQKASLTSSFAVSLPDSEEPQTSDKKPSVPAAE